MEDIIDATGSVGSGNISTDMQVETQKGSSKLLGIASKVMPLVLAASAGGATGGVMSNSLTADSDNSHAIVNFVHKADASGSEMIVQNKDQGIFNEVMRGSNEVQKAEARQEVDMYKSKIAAKPGYMQEHQVIPLKYKRQIEETALAYGISKDTLMGIISVENGGGEDILNKKSGALGVAQFLPATARQYGLHVNSEFDERKNAPKSIAAAGSYLEDNKALFGGNEGMAIWSYHAGPGIVARALRVYFLDVNGEDIKDYGEAIGNNDPVASAKIVDDMKRLIKKDNLNVYQLLHNKKVQEEVISGLDDYSGEYVAQVLAAAELLKENAGNSVKLPGGLKISVASSPH